MSTSSHHYNPDWLSDDALLANFVARQNEFAFLRSELARAPREGSVQHYLLVGVRGAGKTTLLKRIAVAIRRDIELSDHLIALSFPEELYQVKNLADFWWAACDALVDELDAANLATDADRLLAAIAKSKKKEKTDDPLSDAGLRLLQQTCALLKRRPVLLVDNLDMVFQRIDKTGRKLNDPHAPAYWALREALSTRSSPVVIGGSVRLSDPFTHYDKAFYDFFLPKRLGKLRLEEVREVLERLADAQALPDVKQRLQARPGRIETLFELTGGNPRALGLIFELLRNGPNSRAVEDFERLMDLTTPYYKARIEDLSEQAQVVMHALAVREADDGLRFGHTAAEVGTHSGLPTGTVSAQLTILESEGLVEKSAAHGKTQYRIAEQLFRLWLQMRGTRRIRQNVLLLTKFFEAMYDLEELNVKLKENCGSSALAQAKFAFAVAATRNASTSQRDELEAYGVDRLHQHLTDHGGELGDYLPAKERSSQTVLGAGDKPRIKSAAEWYERGNDAKSKGDFAKAEEAYRTALELDSGNAPLWVRLGVLLESDLDRPDDAEVAYRRGIDLDPKAALPWTLLGLSMSKRGRDDGGEEACRKAIELDPAAALAWLGLAALIMENPERFGEGETAIRKAIELDPTAAAPWAILGSLLADDPKRYDEAEDALRKASELAPNDVYVWHRLGRLLGFNLNRDDDAEYAYRRAIELDPRNALTWLSLGILLARGNKRNDEAEAALRHAIDLDRLNASAWGALGLVLEDMHRDDEALAALERSLALAQEQDSYIITMATELRIRVCVAAANKALDTNDQAALHDALTRLLADSADIAASLVSEQFVEGFLRRALESANAGAVLSEMCSMGYEKHARPLVLAYEAALEKRADMLDELEPELQGATKRMFERLQPKPKKKKRAVKRAS